MNFLTLKNNDAYNYFQSFLDQLQSNDASFMLELLNTPGWKQFISDRNVHDLQDASANCHLLKRKYTFYPASEEAKDEI